MPGKLWSGWKVYLEQQQLMALSLGGFMRTRWLRRSCNSYLPLLCEGREAFLFSTCRLNAASELWGGGSQGRGEQTGGFLKDPSWRDPWSFVCVFCRNRILWSAPKKALLGAGEEPESLWGPPDPSIVDSPKRNPWVLPFDPN